MTSGTLHLATVGPRAPAFSFGLILFPYLIGLIIFEGKPPKWQDPDSYIPASAK